MSTYWERDTAWPDSENVETSQVHRLHEEGEQLYHDFPQLEGYPVFWFSRRRNAWQWSIYGEAMSRLIPDTVITMEERMAWVLAQWRMQ